MATSVDCRLCRQVAARRELVGEAGEAVAVRDPFPLTPGHTLVLPRRHEADYFELTAAERADISTLLVQIKERLESAYRPDGFNVGVDVGAAAGQRIAHAHLHVIPRFAGDVPDPTHTGMRWLVPARASLGRPAPDASA